MLGRDQNLVLAKQDLGPRPGQQDPMLGRQAHRAMIAQRARGKGALSWCENRPLDLITELQSQLLPAALIASRKLQVLNARSVFLRCQLDTTYHENCLVIEATRAVVVASTVQVWKFDPLILCDDEHFTGCACSDAGPSHYNVSLTDCAN